MEMESKWNRFWKSNAGSVKFPLVPLSITNPRPFKKNGLWVFHFNRVYLTQAFATIKKTPTFSLFSIYKFNAVQQKLVFCIGIVYFWLILKVNLSTHQKEEIVILIWRGTLVSIPFLFFQSGRLICGSCFLLNWK